MKAIKDIMAEQTQKLAGTEYYRFNLFIKGSEKSKTVGMAYLKKEQSIYTLRLWTFLEDKFYLLPSKDDSAKYLIMTREPNKSNASKNKFFWNIVGNAQANSANCEIELNFDLFDKTIYMNLFPEEWATPYGQPVPENLSEVA